MVEFLSAYIKYLLYPPNNSSDPSPVYATVTNFFTSSATKKFESIDGLPKGNSMCQSMSGNELVNFLYESSISV